jgi:uncharacterized membrane protein YqgA involved in biofilm formation
LIASFAASSLTNSMVNELSAVGGILLVALGFNILNVKHFEVINMLPALLFIILLTLIFT